MKKIKVRKHRRKTRAGSSTIVKQHIRMLKKHRPLKNKKPFENWSEFWNRLQEFQKKSTTLINLDGEDIIVDKSIADLLIKFNNLGYKTTNSCSGLISEHPEEYMKIFGGRISYINFEPKVIKNRKKFFETIEKVGWIVETSRGNIFAKLPYGHKLSDSEIIEKFNDLYNEIANLEKEKILKT
jgi:hypothetical protein